MPVWVILPYRDTVNGDGAEFRDLEVLCERRCTQLGMTCVRVSNRFVQHHRDHPQDQIFFDRGGRGGHLTPLGHRLVAEEVRRSLAASGLIDGA